MTGTSSELLIRELTSVDELRASEQFQRDVWGEDDPADNADILIAERMRWIAFVTGRVCLRRTLCDAGVEHRSKIIQTNKVSLLRWQVRFGNLIK